MRLFATTTIILACSILASGQGKPTFTDFLKEPAFGAKIGGTALDIGTSFKIDGVKFREANPLFRRSNGSFAWERSLLFTGLTTWGQYRFYKSGHRKAAIWLMIADGCLRGFIGARNARLKPR